ncbi:MAG TPA: hypothetical protein ENJ45_05710 [Phaeodactylibacter sp.]|nr:hypothetical protein [Phaeodactylibacter sp.]
MLAIIFTNIAFAITLIYIMAERGQNCYKSSRFWLVLVGLLAALFVAFYYWSTKAGGVVA